jgi:pyridoxamine 5'-phosphate oxidase
MKKIKVLRVDYSGNNMNLKRFEDNPIEQFKLWFEKAQKSNVIEPNAMVLSTIQKNNTPTSRTVLLKEIDKNGFIFFTNYDSRKSKNIKNNKYVSTLFLWKKIERQIIRKILQIKA